MQHPQPRNKLYSRTNLQVPHDEIRLNKQSIAKVSWSEFCQVNHEVLQIYNLVVTKILSRITGITLDLLISVLAGEYYIPYLTINKFIDFISAHDFKDIEFESSREVPNVRTPVIYKSPRIRTPSVSATATRYIPKHIVNDRDGGLTE